MNKFLIFVFLAAVGCQTVTSSALANPDPYPGLLDPPASIVISVNVRDDLEALKLGFETLRNTVSIIKLNVDLNVEITLMIRRLFINLSLFNPCSFQCPNATCTELTVDAVVDIQLILQELVLCYNDLLLVLVDVDVSNILDALEDLIACLGGLLYIDISLLGNGQCNSNSVVADANAAIVLAGNNLVNLNATVSALIKEDVNVALTNLANILIRLELQLKLCISLRAF